MHASDTDDTVFNDVLAGLRRGDFSRLEPYFDDGAGTPAMIAWHEQGRFDDEPQALAEALTCACFLGRTTVAGYLLERGVDPSGGSETGMNAIHWAANRGQLEAVTMLIRAKVPLETRSMYGGTALGTAVWAAVHERRGDQLQIIEALLKAGAQVGEAEYPSGREDVDAILSRYR